MFLVPSRATVSFASNIARHFRVSVSFIRIPWSDAPLVRWQLSRRSVRIADMVIAGRVFGPERGFLTGTIRKHPSVFRMVLETSGSVRHRRAAAFETAQVSPRQWTAEGVRKPYSAFCKRGTKLS
jgi:hypothetical protein